MTQLIGVAAIGAFVIVTSSVAWRILKVTVGIRVGEEEEYRGLDVSEIGLEAYPDFQRINVGGASGVAPGAGVTKS